MSGGLDFSQFIPVEHPDDCDYGPAPDEEIEEENVETISRRIRADESKEFSSVGLNQKGFLAETAEFVLFVSLEPKLYLSDLSGLDERPFLVVADDLEVDLGSNPHPEGVLAFLRKNVDVDDLKKLKNIFVENGLEKLSDALSYDLKKDLVKQIGNILRDNPEKLSSIRFILDVVRQIADRDSTDNFVRSVLKFGQIGHGQLTSANNEDEIKATLAEAKLSIEENQKLVNDHDCLKLTEESAMDEKILKTFKCLKNIAVGESCSENAAESYPGYFFRII